MSEKSRPGTAVWLSGVHQKWMAEKDSPRLSGCSDLWSRLSFNKAMGGQFPPREASLSSRREHLRDVEMRTCSNAGWCVVLPHVGEQKQHEQRPAF